MIRQYCTLFDENYMARGLTMYESLRRHSSVPVQLHVLAMNDETFRHLIKLSLPDMYVHAPELFEMDMQLADIRKTRTWREYCWTCASNLLEYLLRRSFDCMTYLDADIMFFSDPEVVFLEIGEASIAIVPHRFSAKRQYLIRNGIFNVAWVTIKNDDTGQSCVRRWARQCREWCHYRNEGDKFGDQKYLDEWPRLYGDRLHVIENIGVNLAPWNMDHYRVTDRNGRMMVDDFREFRELVFFHFHEFRSSEHLTDYIVSDAYRRLIYEPYIEEINANAEK